MSMKKIARTAFSVNFWAFFLGTSGRALQYAEHTEEFHSAYAVFGLMGAALVILAVILCVDVPQDNDIHCTA